MSIMLQRDLLLLSMACWPLMMAFANDSDKGDRIVGGEEVPFVVLQIILLFSCEELLHLLSLLPLLLLLLICSITLCIDR